VETAEAAERKQTEERAQAILRESATSIVASELERGGGGHEADLAVTERGDKHDEPTNRSATRDLSRRTSDAVITSAVTPAVIEPIQGGLGQDAQRLGVGQKSAEAWDRKTEDEHEEGGDEPGPPVVSMAQLNLSGLSNTHTVDDPGQQPTDKGRNNSNNSNNNSSINNNSSSSIVEMSGSNSAAVEKEGPTSYRKQQAAYGRKPAKLNMDAWESKEPSLESSMIAAVAATKLKAPTRNRRASISSLKTIGAGTGGLDELRAALDSSSVRFALIRLDFGSGVFASTKIIFLHSVGEDTPPLIRARATAHKFAVQTEVGQSHAAVGIEKVTDCTADVILPRVAHLFASEGAELGRTVTKLKEEYAEMLKRALEAGLEKRGRTRMRGTAKTMGLLDKGPKNPNGTINTDFSAKIALSHVREQVGPFNWLLMKPNRGVMELIDAGSLSLAELTQHLDPKEVSYGMLRMGFGSGLFRRTKWVGIWWNGPHASAMTRGKAAGAKEECYRRISPYNLTIEASELEEISLERVLFEVRRASVIDGDGIDSAGGSQPFSAEAFEEALAEEVSASSAFFGDTGGEAVGGGGGGEDVTEQRPAQIAKEVVAGLYNWACFGLPDAANG